MYLLLISTFHIRNIATNQNQKIQKKSISTTLKRPINRWGETNPYFYEGNKLKLYTSVKDVAKDRYGQLNSTSTTFFDDIFNFDFLAPLIRRVRVTIPSGPEGSCLHMREVQVYGYNSDIINLAVRKSASQSSEVNPVEPAGRAVDGNNSTHSHTACGTGTSF